MQLSRFQISFHQILIWYGYIIKLINVEGLAIVIQDCPFRHIFPAFGSVLEEIENEYDFFFNNT